MKMKRTTIAFAVAPLVAAILVMPFAGPILSLVFSYGLSYVFGVPVFLVLRHFHREWHLCYAGAGFTFGVLYTLCTGAVSGTRGDLLTVGTMFGMLGLLVGLSFSLIRGDERIRAQPCAAPNGGPAAPVDNSKLAKGPPSVS